MSMRRILEQKEIQYIIIAAMVVTCFIFCFACFCKRKKKINRKIQPIDLLHVNPMRIKLEKILRII